MEGNDYVRNTVAESLCKALGFERVDYSQIRNDTEPNTSYVRVLDPRASEISFVRTTCQSKQSLYVSCGQLECGVQSVLPSNPNVGLSKMAAPGDWPWMVALFRADTHVCDGTLVSRPLSSKKICRLSFSIFPGLIGLGPHYGILLPGSSKSNVDGHFWSCSPILQRSMDATKTNRNYSFKISSFEDIHYPSYHSSRLAW